MNNVLSEFAKVASAWRIGAAELRDEHRTQAGLPKEVEAGASAMELCAAAIELKVEQLVRRGVDRF